MYIHNTMQYAHLTYEEDMSDYRVEQLVHVTCCSDEMRMIYTMFSSFGSIYSIFTSFTLKQHNNIIISITISVGI